MRWTFFIVLCVLVSSMIIASPVTKETKHKRSLSFLTSLLLSDLRDLGRTQEKCTRAPRRKSSKENQVVTPPNPQKEVVALPERDRDGKRRNQTRSKPKRVRNNNNTSLTNFANDPYQAISQTLDLSNTARPTNVKTTTEKSTDHRPKIQNFSDNRIIANNEPRGMTTDSLNIDQTIYVTPNTYAIPSEIQYVNPIIGIPRKYSYEQGKVDTVQTFALDDNLNIIVTETNKQLPRPAYLDDRIKNIILSVPPYGQEMYPSGVNQQYDDRIEYEQIISSVAPYVNQFYPSTVNHQYQEAGIYPNMVFNQQHGNFDFNLPSNYLPKYTGDPIIVTDDASEVMKTSMPFQDNEINKRIEGNIKEKPRGDIPD